MWVPLLIANAAVALGALIALVPQLGKRALLPVRILATVAAVAVVVLHLVPEAFREIQYYAVAGVAAGMLLPSGVEWLSNRVTGRHDCDDHEQSAIAAHVSFAGLCVHQAGDGIGLWIYANPSNLSVDVAVALAIHTVPLTMLVVMQARDSHHRRDVWRRPLILAVASTLGVLLGRFVPAAFFKEVEPWTASIVSGLLLHVVLHGLSHRPHLDTHHSNS